MLLWHNISYNRFTLASQHVIMTTNPILMVSQQVTMAVKSIPITSQHVAMTSNPIASQYVDMSSCPILMAHNMLLWYPKPSIMHAPNMFLWPPNHPFDHLTCFYDSNMLVRLLAPSISPPNMLLWRPTHHGIPACYYGIQPQPYCIRIINIFAGRMNEFEVI